MEAMAGGDTAVVDIRWTRTANDLRTRTSNNPLGPVQTPKPADYAKKYLCQGIENERSSSLKWPLPGAWSVSRQLTLIPNVTHSRNAS